MGYRNTVQGNVNKAFNLLKDLAVMVTLSSKSDSGFNFATNSVDTQVVTTKLIKAIPITKARRPDAKSSATVQHSFLFKAIDLKDPTIYDSITVIDKLGNVSEVWQIAPHYTSDGFTVTVNVVRAS